MRSYNAQCSLSLFYNPTTAMSPHCNVTNTAATNDKLIFKHQNNAEKSCNKRLSPLMTHLFDQKTKELKVFDLF